MKLSAFDFELPQELIAYYPKEKRDESRLMVVHKDTGKIEHRMFRDIKEYFEEDDVMIANNTKVFPARLTGKKERTNATVEVLVLRELNKEMRLYDCLVDPARKIRVGNKIFFGNDELVAEVVDNTTSRGRTIRFLHDGPEEEFKALMYRLGITPLPRYIQREPEEADKERYQTIYAKHEGAVAAPTAGLHFSQVVMKELELVGVNWTELTLHVGIGTFRTIDVEDLSKHRMEAEYYNIEEEAVQTVNTALANGKKVCAIGTTTMRAIESAVTATGKLKADSGWTNLFIYPPFEFSAANCLLTNFHTPKSSLLIMIAAYMGYDLTMKAYQEALKEKYRFYSYGDAMLII